MMSAKREIERKTVLLVEDEAIIALATERRLRSFGYDVVTANSGESAVLIATERPRIDLVLMDIDLGSGMSGPEAAGIILAMKALPIVFHTSHSERDMVDKVRGITRYGYIIKNSGEFVLRSTLEMALDLFEAHRKTQSSEEEYRKLFENSINGVGLHEIVLDAEGRPVDYLYLNVNAAFERHTGQSAGEVLGKKVTQVLPGREASELIRTYGQVVRTGMPATFEIHIPSLKGHFNISAYKIGERRFAAVFDNISLQKGSEAAMRESEGNMRYVVKHDPNAIAVYDRDLRYLAVSDRYLRDYGVASADIIGRHHYEVFPEMPQKWKEVHARCLAGAIERNEDDSFRRPDGSITWNSWECRPWYRSNGEIGGIITYTEVTTERKEIELELQRGEDRYRTIIQASMDGFAVVDVSGVIVDVNEAYCSMTGFPRATLVGMNIGHLEASEQTPELIAAHMRQIEIQGWDRFESRHRIANGAVIDVEISSVFQTSRQVFLSFIRDISERKAAETEARRLSERIALASRAAHLGIWDWDIAGDKLIWDTRMRELYGIGEAGSSGGYEAWLAALHPDDRARCDAETGRALSGEEDYDAEFRVVNGGSVRHIKAYAEVARDGSGEAVNMIGVNFDITEAKLAEERIQGLLAEKNLLLKEVHHRIKNNMNTMISMLSLQSQTIEEPAAANALQDAQRRMQSMGVLYERLFRSGNLVDLSLKDYLDPLVTEIVGVFPNASSVRVETRIEDFSLDAKTLSTLGIIVNELVTNAMKHAFPDGRRGVLKIAAAKEGGRVTILVEDDGVGLSESLDLGSPSGFGLQLVRMSMAQLGGEVSMEQGPGTLIRLGFEAAADRR